MKEKSSRNDQPSEFIKNVSLKIPMQLQVEVHEYQRVLIWMLSDAASYLNGAITPVDSGRTAW